MILLGAFLYKNPLEPLGHFLEPLGHFGTSQKVALGFAELPKKLL